MKEKIFNDEVNKVIDSCSNTRFANIEFNKKQRSEHVLAVNFVHNIEKRDDVENIDAELNKIYKSIMSNGYTMEEDLLSGFDRPSYCFRKCTKSADIWFHIIYDFSNGCFEIKGVYDEKY